MRNFLRVLEIRGILFFIVPSAAVLIILPNISSSATLFFINANHKGYILTQAEKQLDPEYQLEPIQAVLLSLGCL